MATVDDRKNKLKKGPQDVPTLSDGRRCIRTIRFERSEGQRKCTFQDHAYCRRFK